MFQPTAPSDERIRRFLASQRDLLFSYPEVGASRAVPPAGYNVDHNRIRLGAGPETFKRAVAALRRWEMFSIGWVRLCWPTTPLAVGAIFGVVIKHVGFWSLNSARIVYVIEEDGPIQRYGFAYGTLPGHAERGEERFTVEWRHDDDTVWYDLFAFSRPRHALVWAGYPLARLLQRRFASDSKAAMARAVDVR
ncbi:MAG: DUF1990 family protein [Roseiflexaceae bacterium]